MCSEKKNKKIEHPCTYHNHVGGVDWEIDLKGTLS